MRFNLESKTLIMLIIKNIIVLIKTNILFISNYKIILINLRLLTKKLI